jgi:hypothetical protein
MRADDLELHEVLQFLGRHICHDGGLLQFQLERTGDLGFHD